MAVVPNPALEKFMSTLGDEFVLAEVCIRRAAGGFELCHTADREVAPETLNSIEVEELRALAQTTSGGAFRPLKSAPNLREGWRVVVADAAQLERALSQLYPGALADWFAASLDDPPVTHYRDYTARQTGMYRITTMLNDAQAGQVIRACCHTQFCLKRRLWTVGGLSPDAPAGKSAIPCLEPCPILLEFARKAVRIDQEEKLQPAIPVADLETLKEALEFALSTPTVVEREADFGAASNPRRQRLVLEKLNGLLVDARALRPGGGDSHA